MPASSAVAGVAVFGSWVATAAAASASAAKSCDVFVVRPIITSAGVSLRGRAPTSLLPGSLLVLGPAPELARLGADGWALWGPGTSLPPNPEACLVCRGGPPPGT